MPTDVIINIAVLVLGGALGASVLAIAADDIGKWASPEQRSDWLGFWGAVFGAIIGGGLTLAAGFLAYFAARKEYDAAEAARKQDTRAVLEIAAAYCLGVRDASQKIMDEAKPIFGFTRLNASMTADEIGMTARRLRSILDRECFIVSQGDINTIIYRLPITTWKRLRSLMIDEKTLLNEIKSIENISRNTIDSIKVPIPRGRAITERLIYIRSEAQELHLEYDKLISQL